MTETNVDEGVDVEVHPTKTPKSKNQLQIKPNQNSISAINNINLLDEKDIASAKIFLQQVVRSEKGGIKSIEDGLAVLMRAQDLNIPFSASLEHIHVINGKTGVDIHIIKALLLRAGITWECTKNYIPLYEYTDGINAYIDNQLPDYAIKCRTAKEANEKQKADKDGDNIYVYPVRHYKDVKGNIYKDYAIPRGKCEIGYTSQDLAAITSQGKLAIYRIPNQPVDFITEYKFERIVNGKLLTSVSSFSYNDAINANFFEKDVWKKYYKTMIAHRAFTFGARDIASDCLFGVMETTELKVTNNLDIDEQDVIDITSIQK